MTIEQLERRNEDAKAKYIRRGFGAEKYTAYYVLKYFGLEAYNLVKDSIRDGSLFTTTDPIYNGTSPMENFIDSQIENIMFNQRFEIKQLEQEAA